MHLKAMDVPAKPRVLPISSCSQMDTDYFHCLLYSESVFWMMAPCIVPYHVGTHLKSIQSLLNIFSIKNYLINSRY